MSVYLRGNTWWYKIHFANRVIRESTKTHLKTLAREAEKLRRRQLEEGFNGLTPESRTDRIKTLREAAVGYEQAYRVRNSPNAARYSKYCIQHLTEHLGNKMLIEITDNVVIEYQNVRLRERAANKTINEEVGELFRIMGEQGEAVLLKLKRAKKLRLKEREDVGQSLNQEEEKRLLIEAKKSSSPLIYPALVMALNTGLRDSELRHTTWGQVDLFKCILTVGKSKTAEGAGRTIPINEVLYDVLMEHRRWYEGHVAPVRNQYVFPGGAYRRYKPSKAISSFKTAWTTLKKRTGIHVRFHDTRHTLITKLVESGAGDETIMAIAGHVSRRMLKRYAHIRTEAKRRALEAIIPHEGDGSVPMQACQNL